MLQLLRTDDNVEDVYCRAFEIDWRFAAGLARVASQLSRAADGTIITHELVPGGSGIAVTNANRAQYVAAYVQFLLTTSVAPVRARPHADCS